MKNLLKKLLAIALVATGLAATAQDVWPPKTVKIVSSFPSGAGPDVALRKAVVLLEEKWKTNVVVENRPGGNGIVAIKAFNTEAANSTIFFGTSNNLVVYPTVTNQLELIKNFEPFMGWLKSDHVLIAPAEIKTLDQLKAAMQKNSAFGSWAVGSQSHVNGVVFSQTFGFTPNHVPYKDNGTWFTDVANGLMPFSFTTPATGRALREAGKLNFLAVNSAKRDPRFPEVPTLEEFTGKKINLLNPYVSFVVNSTAPDHIKKTIQNDLVEVIQSSAMNAQLAPIGYLPWNITIPEYKRYLKTYGDDYLTFLKTNKIEIK